MGLTVNVVPVDLQDEVDRFQTNGGKDFALNKGFLGYITDMFDVPMPIKNYLCHLYKVHKIGPRVRALAALGAPPIGFVKRTSPTRPEFAFVSM